MEDSNRFTKVAWGALLVVGLLLPVLVDFNLYLIHVGIIITFNVALATTLWMIWSLGLVSFAHAAFMGIGAYTSALLFQNFGLSMWIGMWVGAFLAGVIALLVSIPLMRTKAVYFFMASWAVGEVVARIFAYFKGTFGGWDGVFNIKPPSINLGFLQLDLSNRIVFYYLALVVGAACVWIVRRTNTSRTGMIYWAIHDNELLAQHTGINVFRQKVICFTIACTLVGLVGALYAHYYTYISPHSFGIWTSEFALVHVIVGGLTTVGGPVAGAISLTIIDEALRPTGDFRTLFFGVVLIATVLVLPGGIETIPGRLRRLFGRGASREKGRNA